MGLVLGTLGRRQDAVLSYRKALQIKPDFIEALNNLAVCLQNQGRIREAIFYFGKAIKLSTDNVPVYHNLSLLYAYHVQVRYLGMQETTGASFFDYLITDKIVTLAGHAPFYTENFVSMPHCYQVNNNRQTVGNQSLNRRGLSLPANGFVFGSFVTRYKIDQDLFHTWMNILSKVRGSVLWLLKRSEATVKNLRKGAECRALDTRLVNGATTTSDALWVGVPVLTLQGSHFVSRMSSSILIAVGLPELVTYSPKSYEDLAIELATDPVRLQVLKARLEKNRLTELLFDTKQFVRNLENGYEQMWQIYTAGELPRHIKVRDCLS